jgi:hypothetical protein
MATLQLLAMEWPFRVIAPCPAPQKPRSIPSNCPDLGLIQNVFTEFEIDVTAHGSDQRCESFLTVSA